MTSINQVLLCAGIHGNEKTGIYLIKKFETNPNLIYRKSFVSKTLLINQKAIKLNRRYCEIDLNRCFDLKEINSNKQLYEQILAQKVYRQVKESNFDFILDFHTSTSNMGLTLMLSNDHPFNLQLAAYLISINPLVKVVRSNSNQPKNRFRHLFPLGFTVEMGAIAPNVIDPVWFSRAEILVKQILDYIEQTNYNQQPSSLKNIPIYSMFETIYFPTDSSGYIIGIVSQELHGNDYCALAPNTIIFNRFDGENVVYQGNNTVYPLFINEAAYWENKIAMYFATKQDVIIPEVVNTIY
ncbi:MAG: aspartoacylase [Cyanobacteria bacterium P01_G01_bin.39]